MLKQLVHELNTDPFKMYTLILLECAIGAFAALEFGLYLYYVGMVALWVPTIILLVSVLGMLGAMTYVWHVYEQKEGCRRRIREPPTWNCSIYRGWWRECSMGCIYAGIGLGGLALILTVVGFHFLGSESEHVVTGQIGVGFLIGAIASFIGMIIAFNE